MRVPTPVWLVFVWSCGFSPASNTDARPADTAPPADAPPIAGRVRQGLIGFWTFNDPKGSPIAADTAGTTSPVNLDVEVNGRDIIAPTFDSGFLVVNAFARLFSAASPHLNIDCITAGAVTLEVWAKPAVAVSSDPLFVAGLASNILERNVALLQTGNRWVGRVRTTAAQDGTPDLTSTSTVSPAAFTHIAIVADPSQRVMYIDDSSQAAGTPGPLTAWDPSFRMALVDEVQHARMWTGTLALVALYNRALTREEVHQNFAAGPNN